MTLLLGCPCRAASFLTLVVRGLRVWSAGMAGAVSICSSGEEGPGHLLRCHLADSHSLPQGPALSLNWG